MNYTIMVDGVVVSLLVNMELDIFGHRRVVHSGVCVIISILYFVIFFCCGISSYIKNVCVCLCFCHSITHSSVRWISFVI